MTSRLAPPFASTSTSLSSSTRPSSPSSHSHSLKRTASAISLPSPPDELAESSLPLGPSYLDIGSDADLATDEEEDEEVDQLDSDQEDAPAHVSSTSNPFVVPSASTSARQQQQEQEEVAARPDHPLTSPTHRAKRLRKGRRELDRISLGESGGDKGKGKGKGVSKMGRGWDSPDNPFIEREGEGERISRRVGEARKNRAGEASGGDGKEEMVTYVFRGKRIHYDLPLSSLLASEDPSDSPFPDPSPRLLFPPAAPITPPSATPSSSFLDALRATTQKKGSNAEQEGGGRGLPPTPVTEKRKAGRTEGASKGEGRFGPYKRMKAMKEPETGGMRN